MLPNPLSPSTTLPHFLSSARRAATSPRLRIATAFFLLGLINNVLYVIILSAALDLVGPTVPKGLVLLFDVTPALFIKLLLPFFIDRIPWNARVWFCVALAFSGMALIALSPTTVQPPARSPAPPPSTVDRAKDKVKALFGAHGTAKPSGPGALELSVKMLGIALASLSSGAGESSFVALTSSYDAGRASLAAWGSGTGAAGLVGASAYLVATTTFRLSSRTALIVFSFLPVGMLAAYFVVLPVADPGARLGPGSGYFPVAARDESDDDGVTEDDQRQRSAEETGGSEGVEAYASKRKEGRGFTTNLLKARSLLIPYMIPLFLVYLAEYTINQGISPTLLYPLKETPFKAYREFYPTYGTLYQLGVFISRSSLPFLRIQALYIPSLLQCANVLVFIAQALTFTVLPNVYITFAIMFYEGLLGGLVYISTFRRIGEEVPPADREFSLAVATVSDTSGIFLASFIGMAVETSLCKWQVSKGRDWCTRF